MNKPKLGRPPGDRIMVDHDGKLWPRIERRRKRMNREDLGPALGISKRAVGGYAHDGWPVDKFVLLCRFLRLTHEAGIEVLT